MSAAPAPILNYQAKVQSAAGESVADGTYTVRFRIYDALTGGNVLWEETHRTRIESGIASVRLGSLTPIGLDFNSDGYYLGVKIGNDSELSPRKQLDGVPFALNARKLDGRSVGADANNIVALDGDKNASLPGSLRVSNGLDIVGGAVNIPASSLQGAALIDGSISTAKLADQAVTGAKVADGTVTAAKLSVSAINAAGLIPALTGAYVSNLDGSALTNIGAASLQNNSIGFSQLSNALVLDANTSIAMNARNLFYNLTGTGEFTIALDGVDATFAIEQDDNPFIQAKDGSFTVQLPTTSDSMFLTQTVGIGSNALVVSTTPSVDGTNSSGIVIAQQASVSGSGLFSGLTINNQDNNTPINSAITINNGGGGGYNWYMIAPNFEITNAGGLKVGCSGGGACSTLDRYFETISTVDFGNTVSGACTESGDIVLNGSAMGDRVTVATGANALAQGIFLTGHVTAANTVRIQYCNLSGVASDPVSDNYTVSAIR